MLRLPRLSAVCLLSLCLTMSASLGQDSNDAPATGTNAPATDSAPPSIDTSEREAGDESAPKPRRQFVKWNEYEGPISTFRFGFGFLVDFSAYEQDSKSEQQVSRMHSDYGVRDSRLLFRGKFQTKFPFSWTVGYMYDGANDEWRFRQTGILIGGAVRYVEPGTPAKPNWSVFIGRTKEGYSMIKVMTGYHPWTQERSPGLDAFVPILADGVKFMTWFPKARVFFSFGVFGDKLSEDESFATFDYLAATRVGWLPIGSVEDKTVWHVAVMGRGGRPDEGKIRFRSRPEDYLSPYFVETPEIFSDRAITAGVESYYRKGPWLFGGEYNWQMVDPTSGEDLMFHAGDVVTSWIITGETRGYNARGGYFDAVSPDRTVFEGGPGAWEAVLHLSYIDLDDASIRGGKLWRLTSMVNWHMSDNIRLELIYGHSILDRFGLEGRTHFFQSRLQFIL